MMTLHKLFGLYTLGFLLDVSGYLKLVLSVPYPKSRQAVKSNPLGHDSSAIASQSTGQE
jgi:hypothetical protein